MCELPEHHRVHFPIQTYKQPQPQILIVYVDDIILTDSDMHEMENLKQLIAKEFEIKYLGASGIFWGG